MTKDASTPKEFGSRTTVIYKDEHGQWIPDDAGNADIAKMISKFPSLAEKARALLSEAAISPQGRLVLTRDLRKFGSDFHDAYFTASGEITNLLSPQLVLDVFRLLSRLAPYWTLHDAEMWHQLPEVVTIYRGGTGKPEELAKGFSWTIDIQIALYHAQNTAKEKACTVIEASVPRHKILAVDLMEQEVVIDPSGLEYAEISL